MLARGVRLRDCSSFGLPAYVRLGVRAEPDVTRLVAAWQTVAP
jgi:histidinol-phosphate/aromatic aminotransferase/cobyric acid decarboxylase-like protein